ncbi:hypothetical protein AB0E82_33860 [Streptomyces anulatus]
MRQRRTCSAGEKKTRLSAGVNIDGCGIPVREPGMNSSVSKHSAASTG